MEGFEAKSDNEILDFNFNDPKMLSSLSFNSVDQQHSPLGYDTIKSTPASGNYQRTPSENTNLGPAPRSQLGVPTRKVYKGKVGKYYKPILDNANWVRGNQFGVDYPYKKNDKFVEVVAIPNVKVDKKTPADYLGNDAKIVMRNNDPFYPYPSQHLLENKNYWSYMHPYKYMNEQPIYNYPHGKIEGGDRGLYKGGKGYDAYDAYDNFVGCQECNEYNVVEGFEGCAGGCNLVEGYDGTVIKKCKGMDKWIFIFFVIFLCIIIYYFFVVRR